MRNYSTNQKNYKVFNSSISIYCLAKKYINTPIFIENLIAKKEAFILAFRVWGDTSEIFDSFLPLPNILKKIDMHSYLIAWLIEGYFLTKENQKFLKDIIEKILDTLIHYGAVKIEWIGWINLAKLTPNDILSTQIYNLKDDIAPFTQSDKKAKRKSYKALELLASYHEYKESDDAFFDWLRFKIYDFVKENGKNALTLDYCKELAIIGYEIMGHKKGISTPLAKAKAIYNWVMENYNPKNNWNYQRKLTDEEYEMTRKEIALRNARMRAEQTKEKVYKAIEKLKKNGEKITILKIAEIANVNKNSANKYLKQAREEGIV
jgi:hypothetical protein